MNYAVQPILIWPASMAAIPGYRAVCDKAFEAVQSWYRERVVVVGGGGVVAGANAL